MRKCIKILTMALCLACVLCTVAKIPSASTVVEAADGAVTIVDSNDAELSKNVTIGYYEDDQAKDNSEKMHEEEGNVYTTKRAGKVMAKATFYPGGTYTVKFKFKSNHEGTDGKDAYPRLDVDTAFKANGTTVKGEQNWTEIENLKAQCKAGNDSIRNWKEFSYTFEYEEPFVKEITFSLLTHWQCADRVWEHSFKDIVITESGNPDKITPDSTTRTKTKSSPSLVDGTVDGNSVTSKSGDYKITYSSAATFNNDGSLNYVFDGRLCIYWGPSNTVNINTTPYYGINQGAGRHIKFDFKFDDPTKLSSGLQYNSYGYLRYYSNDNNRWADGAPVYKDDENLSGNAWLDYNNALVKKTENAVSLEFDILKFDGVGNDNGADFYRQSQAIEFVPKNSSDSVVFYGVDFTETTPIYKVRATQNDNSGSVKLTSRSLNFEEESIKDREIAGSHAYVEHNMTATFNISAPSGKKIEKAILNYKDGTKLDLTASVIGKSSAKLAVTLIKQPAVLDVVYAENPTVLTGQCLAKKGSFTYTDKDNSETKVDVSNKEYIMMYAICNNNGKDLKECGFSLKNSAGEIVKLKAIAVPVGNAYAIRAFGDGLVAGQTYTATPYIVNSSDVEITGASVTVSVPN